MTQTNEMTTEALHFVEAIDATLQPKLAKFLWGLFIQAARAERRAGYEAGLKDAIRKEGQT